MRLSVTQRSDQKKTWYRREIMARFIVLLDRVKMIFHILRTRNYVIFTEIDKECSQFIIMIYIFSPD